MYYITKEFTFDAAHHIVGYKGLCANVHGHTYKLWVTLKLPSMNQIGIAYDFKDLKERVKTEIIDKLDHKDLNDIYEQTTAEFMSQAIYFTLKDAGVPVYEIKLWETPTSFVTFNENE